jgi:outer membrane protein assembly factor BamD (BamD/ComL family)
MAQQARRVNPEMGTFLYSLYHISRRISVPTVTGAYMDARRLIASGFLCCAILLAACGSANYEWSQASHLDTIAAYQAFVSKYPNDVRTADANSRITELKEAQAWNAAQTASSVEGYQQYLTAEPSGEHAQAARDEIAARERVAAWRTAQLSGTTQSLQDFLQKYPTGAEADAARDKLKLLVGYRAELGTARTKKLAERERDALAKRFGKNFQQVVVLEPDATTHDYRITSAPMSQNDANTACATVKQSGRSCEVIQVAS